MTAQQRRFKAAAHKAKALYKTGRYKTYGDAVAAAFKKSGGGGVKRSSTKRKSKPARKRKIGKGGKGSIVTVKDNRVQYLPHRSGMKGIGGIGKISAGTLKTELKRRITDKIDRAVVNKYHATKKRIKNKFQKTITAAKSELRKLC